jgi:hypothetical protein
MLRLRHQILHRFVASHTKRNETCPTDRYVIITEYQFGRTGNNMIEFTHGLWVSEKLSATLIAPIWMNDLFTPFDTTLLQSHFCYTMKDKVPAGTKKFEITSEDSFFAYKLFQDPEYSKLLPSMSEETINDLSLHFLTVYSALWSFPDRKILQAAEYIISKHLDANFDYGVVHKRQLEGGCSKLLSTNTKLADYSPMQLPMKHVEWSNNIIQSHPLCEMTYDFVRSTLQMHQRNHSKLYVAFDGRGQVNDYVTYHSIFSNILDNTLHASVDRKSVDMLLAMHSGLFVMNPRSTFSWQIYLIRIVMALPSVPTIKNNDLYLQRNPEDLVAQKRGLWVSWWSTASALLTY